MNLISTVSVGHYVKCKFTKLVRSLVLNRTSGMGSGKSPIFDRSTSGHCNSVGNQSQITSGGVLESSALALHDCTIGQIPISYPCERVPLEK